ncbi:MAG: endosialidase [Lachnospiraceae bacterium]|nr:endosialidase [Lachnospiraceae bacterium]
MAVIEELIRTEQDGTISFGDYTLPVKTKKADFEHDGDLYKIKTFNEITKLERNGLFVYESVPGTAVHNLNVTENCVTFSVEGSEDAMVTLELEPESEYKVTIDGSDAGSVKTNLGGKLPISVELGEGKCIRIQVEKL